MKLLQGSRRLLPVEALQLGRDHADGVLCSANVPRPAASSFISLRRAHHRRDLDAQLLIDQRNTFGFAGTRRTFCASAALMLVGCAATRRDPRAGAIAELGSTGTLRAAINFGNPILASRGADGAPRGVSVDLAREAARRLGLAVELIPFSSAGSVVDAVKTRTVDLAFVAIDPVRAADMEYTAPYVIIEGAYLVRNDSPLRRNEDVDRAGTRIAVGRGSAYDLFLTREIKSATLVRAATSPAVTDLFLSQNLEVAAGVKQQLEADAKRVGDVRLLPGRFMVIEQAIGVPKGRTAAQAWLGGFIEEMKASGFVAASLQRHGIEGAAVAPTRTAT